MTCIVWRPTSFGKNLRCDWVMGGQTIDGHLGAGSVRWDWAVGGNDKDKLTPHGTAWMKCFLVASCILLGGRPDFKRVCLVPPGSAPYGAKPDEYHLCSHG